MELSTQTRNAIASRQLFALAASEADVSIGADASGIRLVSGLVVPFDVEVDRGFFTGIFRADSTELPDDLSTVKLLVDHDQTQPVGYGIEASKDPDGLRMTFAVPTDHPRSAGYLEDLDALLKDGFSVGVEYTSDTVDAIVARMFGEDDSTGAIELGAVVREVSGLAVPAFNGARVGFRPATLATFGTINPKEHTPVTTVTDPSTIPDPAVPAVVELPTTAELAALVRAELGATYGAPAHPLAAFATFDEFASAVWNNDPSVRDLARFALVDQITANNPGVIPPAWLTEIQGIIDAGRPLIEALGGPQALPADGMTLTWPYFDGTLSSLIGEQVTQKTEVTSARVDIKQGTSPIKTYAGASDIAYQLLRRSSPAYRDAYERILALAYAAVSEAAFEDFVEAAATALVVGVTTTPAQIRAALFKGSRAVKSATGLPASVVAVASNIFDTWGGLDGLTVPVQYGTQNVMGTADASELRINVSGLDVVDCPAFANGLVVMTNRVAAQWFEDGPFPVSADDVAKLGQDVGMWGMGAPRIKAAGVVKLTAA